MCRTNLLASRFCVVLLVLTLSFSFLYSCRDGDVLPNGSSNIIVEIEDPILLEIILGTLGLENPSELTENKIKDLRELVINNTGVVSLNGLEKAENLEVMVARSLEVVDLNPISSLTNLVQLDMRDALLPTDLSILAPLQKIENIDFRNTAVTDISALRSKNSLTHINLRETDVEDISALEGMTGLLYLNLNRAGGGNGISNPEFIVPMNNLFYLNLRNTTLGDELFAQIFANKTRLVEANLRSTGITSVAPLVPLFEAGAFTEELSLNYNNRISLDLQNNPIIDLCLIADWQNNFPEGELEWSSEAGDLKNCNGESQHEFVEDSELLSFILSSLGLDHPAALTEESIKNLKTLNISGSTVSSLAGLEFATNLEEFNARDCQALTDISALSGLGNLVFINLRESAVSDISPLEGMVQLQYLNLNRTGNGDGISNPEILAPFVNLYYLNLRNTKISDEQFKMFENFDQLVECNLRNTGITSVAPLAIAFEKGAFTKELAVKYGNNLSLDLQNNSIEDLCLLAPFASVFAEGELEWSGSFSFDDCD